MARILELDSVKTFLDHASRSYFAEARGHWVFRGHSDINYTLIPSVGRGQHKSKSREKYERSLFDIFRRESHGFLRRYRQTGNGSPLSAPRFTNASVDWTYNPLVGLYFAVEANPEADGKVFALRALNKASKSVGSVSPLTLPLR